MCPVENNLSVSCREQVLVNERHHSVCGGVTRRDAAGQRGTWGDVLISMGRGGPALQGLALPPHQHGPGAPVFARQVRRRGARGRGPAAHLGRLYAPQASSLTHAHARTALQTAVCASRVLVEAPPPHV